MNQNKASKFNFQGFWSEVITIKVFKYEVMLSNDNDRDYYKTGLVVSESEEKAQNEVYEYYDAKTTDYVSHNIILTEISLDEGIIIEDWGE